ncbi:MAG TPA: DUF4386 family protein [Chthoniobacterales bacterium]|jgi:hypothetical protein|nr:DUF4386 family protein [Chthoniobacterales bacterium]
MHPLKKAARIAGAVYLSMIVTGPFSLIYVPSKLIVRGNAAATADLLIKGAKVPIPQTGSIAPSSGPASA